MMIALMIICYIDVFTSSPPLSHFTSPAPIYFVAYKIRNNSAFPSPGKAIDIIFRPGAPLIRRHGDFYPLSSAAHIHLQAVRL